MSASITHDSRNALSRAELFLEKAKRCPGEDRAGCEAFIDAAIIFARAAVHRLKKKYNHHPDCNEWWDSIRDDPAVVFFRKERDWILKEAPAKIGQKLFAQPIGDSIPKKFPEYAKDFYYYEGPDIPATKTIEKHLDSLKTTLARAEQRFSGLETQFK